MNCDKSAETIVPAESVQTSKGRTLVKQAVNEDMNTMTIKIESIINYGSAKRTML